MKYSVCIPILVKRAMDPGDDEKPKEYALTIAFGIEASNEIEAAQKLYERLEAYCGDP